MTPARIVIAAFIGGACAVLLLASFHGIGIAVAAILGLDLGEAPPAMLGLGTLGVVAGLIAIGEAILGEVNIIRTRRIVRRALEDRRP